MHSFDKVFCPHSVAIVGASNDPARISGRSLHYLIRSRYAGAIFPINNRSDVVQGLPAYKSLFDLPQVPDMALICVSAAQVTGALEDCVALGVGAAVIFASGYAETDTPGRIKQKELADIAKKGGLRLIGPNCLGLLNSRNGFTGTFSSGFDKRLPDPGPVAIVSQSGAYGGHVAYLCMQRGLGISYWISTGNEAATDVADCIDWLARQDEVRVILAYAEGVSDGRKFVDALRVAHDNKKAVVFMKVGQSEKGALAAQSHTASLAGSDAVYEGLFRQYGVYRARTTEEQVDIAYACSRGVYPEARKVGIITVSGGFGIQLCDAAERYQLDVSPLPAAAGKKLKEINPLGTDNNPCDTTAGWLNDMSLITRTYEVMYEDGGYDSTVGAFTILPATPSFGERIKEAIGKGTAAHIDSKPTLLCMEADDEVVRSYEKAGFLIFKDSDRAMQALGALARIKEGFDMPVPEPRDGKALAVPLQNGPLSEVSALRYLQKAGVDFMPCELVTSVNQAIAAARHIGYPVVMKIVSPQIVHKTEMGGVIVNIGSDQEVAAHFNVLMQRAKSLGDDIRIEGVLVVKMAPKGVETIIGVNNDPLFGPVVMFGLGGIFTELFKDVVFRVAPFGVDEARRMIREIKGHALLDGFRGSARADVNALARLLSSISEFAVANSSQFSSMDLNPVMVFEEGQGACALDAVVVGACHD
ncbi:acetate--CoA ligase family protein [Paralcaligenes sp. KSB-10]|uniref:acetate--CoA ligase family protein n=1 Tax=Paralcaligenes sp. KSB-10 TaxID=2901142 RepID=UPI001E444062|nr:acetate--CoA ligase family protein [Paralcaligenes sp. KSB-10]UHL65439.1 acetate--CoA ligase family protein [Paralcaligenes sp. KSB-10]